MADTAGQNLVPQHGVDHGTLAVGRPSKKGHLHVVTGQHILDPVHFQLKLLRLLHLLPADQALFLLKSWKKQHSYNRTLPPQIYPQLQTNFSILRFSIMLMKCCPFGLPLSGVNKYVWVLTLHVVDGVANVVLDLDENVVDLFLGLDEYLQGRVVGGGVAQLPVVGEGGERRAVVGPVAGHHRHGAVQVSGHSYCVRLLISQTSNMRGTRSQN